MGPAHDHHHGGDTTVSSGRLAATAGVNVGFAVVQVAVGLIIGSVVVLADSLHQVVDAVGLVTALIAIRLGRRPADRSMTFGWGKADALGAFTSGLLLVGSIVWVVVESIDRLRHPVDVAGPGVIAIGLAGIVVNGGSVLLLGGGGHLAIRAARLHLLVDLAGSVIVVATGIVLAGTSIRWIDPVASLVVNAMVLRGTWALLRRAAGELLDRSPEAIAPERVVEVLRSHPSVAGVHHVHSRRLGADDASITAHVVVDGASSLHDAQVELDELRELLATRLGVVHATLQLECHECGDVEHEVGASSVHRPAR